MFNPANFKGETNILRFIFTELDYLGKIKNKLQTGEKPKSASRCHDLTKLSG